MLTAFFTLAGAAIAAELGFCTYVYFFGNPFS